MQELEFILMTTAWGGRDTSALRAAIPNLQISLDIKHDAMGNFLNSMRMTDKPCVHIEDDIELCDNFVEKITAAVNEYPNYIINFFSLRKEDYEIGKPHFVAGSRFMMNQCFYIPAGVGQQIADYYEQWVRKHEHPTGYDLLMADFMKDNKMRYVQWFPHLVNHIECKSLINPKRSSKRTDKNFTK